jgi:alpha-tubulin suppressor-like RCC1 family protein
MTSFSCSQKRKIVLVILAIGSNFCCSSEIPFQREDTTLSAGQFHTCAIEARVGVTYGGPIKCFGFNAMGQASPPPGMFIQVSCGHSHTCAIRADQRIACWGTISNPPNTQYFNQISSGELHTCGVLRNGEVFCWGHNDFGESSPPGGTFQQVRNTVR